MIMIDVVNEFPVAAAPQVVRTCEYEATPVNIFIQCSKGHDGGSAQHFLLFRNNEEVAKSPQPIFNISVGKFVLLVFLVYRVLSKSSFTEKSCQ